MKIDNLWKRDKKLPQMFFYYLNLLQHDNSRGYKAFKALSLIYGKKDKRILTVQKISLNPYNAIINVFIEDF